MSIGEIDMSCCRKLAPVRVERVYVAAINRPKIVYTTKHNFNNVQSTPIVKPFNDREKNRM